MTRRIISCLVGLTASLLVAALAGGTAWAVSPAPISYVHAQVRLVAQPEDCEDTDPGDTDAGDTDPGDTAPGNTGPGMDADGMDTGPARFRGPEGCMTDDPESCGMTEDGKQKSCPGSNSENGTNSTAVCEDGLKLMTIDAMLRSVAAPGTASELMAKDANRDDHLCVKLAADGRSMTRFVDNNPAV
jgi:hypothetical protein